MKVLRLVGFVGSLLSFAPVQALTVDEIIKLKKADVSDTTIDLRIETEG